MNKLKERTLKLVEADERFTPQEKENIKGDLSVYNFYNDLRLVQGYLEEVIPGGCPNFILEKLANTGTRNQARSTIKFDDLRNVGKRAIVEEANEKEKNITTAFINTFNLETILSKFLDENPIFYDRSKIFWCWNKQKHAWEIQDETDLISAIRKAIDSTGQIFGSKTRTEVFEALKILARERTPKQPKETWVQFKNKIVDIETEEEFEATPEYFIFNSIPYELGKTENTPTIDKIFIEWVGEEWKTTLYEIIGFCLIPKYFLNRFFFLNGKGRNGKGKYTELISKLLGETNVTSSDLDLLTGSNKSRFETFKLYKKLVVFMGETNFKTISHTSLLKKLSGGDLIGFEAKNKNPFDSVNTARPIIATNQPPLITDKSDGMKRRIMIIDFPNQFTEKKDILKTIPEDEYNNLALKCLNILKRLWREREFTNEGSVEERGQRYEERSNPLKKFINDFYEFNLDATTPLWEFRQEFQTWLLENGYSKISDKQVSQQLKNEGYETKIINEKQENGTTKTVRHILDLSRKKQNITGITDITGIPTQSLRIENQVGSSVISVINQKNEKNIIESSASKHTEKPIITGSVEIQKIEGYEPYISDNDVVGWCEFYIKQGHTDDEIVCALVESKDFAPLIVRNCLTTLRSDNK